MDRRRFLLTSLAGALAAPLAAQAQQPGPWRGISMAGPGSNLTDVTEPAEFTFSVMKQIMPRLSRVAYLWNADIENALAGDLSALRGCRSVEKIAGGNSVQAYCIPVCEPEDFYGAFNAIRRLRAEAVWVASDGMLLAAREWLAELAGKQRLPFFGGLREYAGVGGIMAYAPKYSDAYRPEQRAEFKLVINAKTAKALGLTIPPSLLARADQVIE